MMSSKHRMVGGFLFALSMICANANAQVGEYPAGSKYRAGYYWSSGWDTAKTYEIGGHNYLIVIKSNYSGSSKVNINILGDNCASTGSCIGAQIATYTWTAGWTDVVIYEHGSNKYFMFYKESTGEAHVHLVNANGTIGTRQYPDVNLGASLVLSEYYLANDGDAGLAGCNNSDGGNLKFWDFSSNGVPVFSFGIPSAKGCKALKYFHHTEEHFLFLYYNDGSLTMGSLNSEYFWSNTMSTDWDLVDFYYVDDFPYLMLYDAGTGNYETYSIMSNGWIADRVDAKTTTAGYSSMSSYIGAVDGKTYWHAIKVTTGYTAVYHVRTGTPPSYFGLLGHRGAPLGALDSLLGDFTPCEDDNPYCAQNMIDGMLQLVRDPSNAGTEFDVHWDGSASTWRVAHDTLTGHPTVSEFLDAVGDEMASSDKTFLIEVKGADGGDSHLPELIEDFLAPLDENPYGVDFYVGTYGSSVNLQDFADEGYRLFRMILLGTKSCTAANDIDVSDAFNTVHSEFDEYRENTENGVEMLFMSSWLSEPCTSRFEELSLAASSPAEDDYLLISYWGGPEFTDPNGNADPCAALDFNQTWSIKQDIWDGEYPEDEVFFISNMNGFDTSTYLKWQTGLATCP